MAVYDTQEMTLSDIARFWKYVEKKSEGDCWPWKGAKDSSGYGHLGIGGKLSKAHRLSLAISGVDVSASPVIRHKCDNPECVNPSHLLRGTHADNMRDKVERGRSPGFSGENNPSAKLTDEQALEIRASDEKGRVLAARYGISEAQVSKVRLGKTFKGIGGRILKNHQSRTIRKAIATL